MPFPVFEKKGTAKYDKVAKTLTVTMPVQPGVTPDTETIPSTVTVTDNKDEVNDNCKDSSTDELPKNAGEKKVVKKEEIMKGSNSRWVGDKEGLEVEEMRIKNEELKNEIKIKSLPVPPFQVTLSKAKAEANELHSSLPAPSSPVSISEPVSFPVTASNPSSSGTVSSAIASNNGGGDGVDGTFKPCKSFEGQREGFLFKRGELGQGYYLDNSESPLLLLSTPLPSSAHSTLPQSSSPPPSPSLSLSPSLQSNPLNYTSKPCPLEFRQTKQAIAVLIQISGILLDSATVTFNEYTVDIEFRALGSDSRIFDDEGTHVNPIIASSTSVARLTGNNTAINANSILNKTENLDISIKSLSQEKIALTDLYGVRLTSLVRLNKNLCKYDIASRNMVLVLTKDEEGFYEESEGSKVLSSVSFKAGESCHVMVMVLNVANILQCTVS